MTEQWKEINWIDMPNTNVTYEISNTGLVRNKKTNRILKPGKNQYGYLIVNLKGKITTVHRLVAVAFLCNPDKKSDVDHINGNKEDNNVANLRWASRSENQFNRTFRNISGKERYIKNRLNVLFNYVGLTECDLDEMIKEITNNNTLTIDFNKYKITE